MNPLLRKIIAVLLLVCATSTGAQAKHFSATARSWLRSQVPNEGARRELSHFPPGLHEDYVSAVLKAVPAKSLRDLEAVAGELFAGTRCRPRIEVNFLNDLSVNVCVDESAEQQFESHVIHVQMLSCLPEVTANQVAKAYMTSEFKAKGADSVFWSDVQGHRICQKTKVKLMGLSSYCYDENKFRAPEGIYFHSFNDWNDPTFKVPVYFREITTVITDTNVEGQPGTAFYTNIYLRAGNVPLVLRQLATPSIIKSQRNYVDLLQQMAAQ